MDDMIKETALGILQNEEIQNKATNALGMLFPYVGLEKKALDMYIEDIENSSLSSNSKILAVLDAKRKIKSLKNQCKIADYAINNAKEGTDFSENCGVDCDWFERFMHSGAFVSSENMQVVWGNILAKEFEKPGSIPPNMIRILSEFTPKYADIFRKLCSMKTLVICLDNNGKAISAEWVKIIPYSSNTYFFDDHGICFEDLNELEMMGVIRFNSISGYVAKNIEKKHVLFVINGKVLEFDFSTNMKFPIGDVMFTNAGKVLDEITEKYYIDNYFDIIKEYYLRCGAKIIKDSNYNVNMVGEEISVQRN